MPTRGTAPAGSPILHLALSTRDLTASIADYSQRLGCAPRVVVPGVYALWRTPQINLKNAIAAHFQQRFVLA